MGGGRAGIHELNALGAVDGAGGREVDLQVADRLQGGTYLQVLCGTCRRGRGNAVVREQPAAVAGLVDVAVARQAESEVQSWREQSVGGALPEHVAHGGHEARQGHGILIAIAHVDRAEHHQEAGHLLCGVVPPLIVERLLRRDIDLQLQGFGGDLLGLGPVVLALAFPFLVFGRLVGRCEAVRRRGIGLRDRGVGRSGISRGDAGKEILRCPHLNLVLVDSLPLHGHGLAVLVLSRHDEALRLLAMLDDDAGVTLQRDLLLE